MLYKSTAQGQLLQLSPVEAKVLVGALRPPRLLETMDWRRR